jgi:predicted acyltransferase
MSLTNQSRFLALDVFRGMTICFMIIVNTPGNSATTFAPLLHAKWHGFTPTDLVFPSFLFAVGNAMAFVMPKWEALSNTEVVTKILKRSFIIFLLGFLMYWFPFVKTTDNGITAFPFSETRVFGVLQRIALCYGIAALMLHFLKPRTTYILGTVFLLLYWGLAYWLSASPDPLSLEGNAVLRIDKWLLGEKHLYHGEGIAFDPEGLLSTLPAIANVIGGFWAGDLVRKKGKTWESLSKLLLAGVFFLFIAWCWNGFFPVNKKLWTSSFVVLTVGLDCIILAAIIYIIDFRKKEGWSRFFTVFGKNPLFIYLLSELIAILLWFFNTSDGTPYYNKLYQLVFSHIGGYFGSLMFALTIMMTCWLVGWWMDRRKIYVRV